MDLQKQIYDSIVVGVAEAIKDRLNRGYADNPLNKLIDSVVVSREAEIRKLIEDAIDGALIGDFRTALRDAVTHKLARVITSKLEGEIEKRANELRASPEVRARITLAIDQALKSVS
jgi:hypothetical protein